MAASIPVHTTIRNPLKKYSVFHKTHHFFSQSSSHPRTIFTLSAKFQLSEIMGGRGLCNGEAGLEKELKRTIQQDPSPNSHSQPSPSSSASSSPSSTNDEAFEKELLGLTGGFPGGEKGLMKFIQENPPPKKTSSGDEEDGIVFQGAKPRAPDLPLFLPGMIVIVKNPNNPYHMYCGIVQRVTDGKAGVLFEGGNWDRLITFKLDELERREKGPPMVNPKSCVLESIVEQGSLIDD